MTITNLFRGAPADHLVGPERMRGNSVIVDGRVVPRMLCRDLGDRVEFLVDERFAFTFPKEVAYLAASMAAECMAIGAGYPSFNSDGTPAPFAPRIAMLGEVP